MPPASKRLCIDPFYTQHFLDHLSCRDKISLLKKTIRPGKMIQEVKALSTYDGQHKANIESWAVGAREIVQ